MDAAKAIAIVSTNEGHIWDYVQQGRGGRKPIAKAPLPIVAVTTTAGTGSEVDGGGVITNPETREKIGIGGPSRPLPEACDRRPRADAHGAAAAHRVPGL